MGIMKAYELEVIDAGQAACEDFHRKHGRPPDNCDDGDIAECMPLAGKYMTEFGWKTLDDRMRSDPEDAICSAVEYWDQ